MPGIVALFLEPLIFLLADRHPRRWFVVGGLAVMGLTAFASALAPGPVWLAATVAVAWVATGTGVTLAQSTLCDANPDRREQVLTRWTLLGVVGDLGGPALFAVLAWLSLGWRSAYLVVGVVIAALTLLLVRQPFPAPTRDDDDEPPLLAALGIALRNKRLLLWLAACSLCDLLDEIFLVFASLRLRDELGADVATQSAALAILIAAEAIGLALCERLLRRMPSRRLLALSAVACAIAYAGWLAAPNLALAIVALAAVGLTVAPLYPLTAAECYAALPDRSGAVHAAGHVFTPVMLILPWLLGWIADRAGTTAALAVLGVAPLGILLAAGSAARAKPPEG